MRLTWRNWSITFLLSLMLIAFGFVIGRSNIIAFGSVNSRDYIISQMEVARDSHQFIVDHPEAKDRLSLEDEAKWVRIYEQTIAMLKEGR